MKKLHFLVDVLRAENNKQDLQISETDMNIIVCAQRENLELYEIGRVSRQLQLENPKAFNKAIGLIKFGKRS